MKVSETLQGSNSQFANSDSSSDVEEFREYTDKMKLSCIKESGQPAATKTPKRKGVTTAAGGVHKATGGVHKSPIQHKRDVARGKEQRRLRTMNAALANLRDVVPAEFCEYVKKHTNCRVLASKVNTLRCAATYIAALAKTLGLHGQRYGAYTNTADKGLRTMPDHPHMLAIIFGMPIQAEAEMQEGLPLQSPMVSAGYDVHPEFADNMVTFQQDTTDNVALASNRLNPNLLTSPSNLLMTPSNLLTAPSNPLMNPSNLLTSQFMPGLCHETMVKVNGSETDSACSDGDTHDVDSVTVTYNPPARASQRLAPAALLRGLHAESLGSVTGQYEFVCTCRLCETDSNDAVTSSLHVMSSFLGDGGRVVPLTMLDI